MYMCFTSVKHTYTSTCLRLWHLLTFLFFGTIYKHSYLLHYSNKCLLYLLMGF